MRTCTAPGCVLKLGLYLLHAIALLVLTILYRRAESGSRERVALYIALVLVCCSFVVCALCVGSLDCADADIRFQASARTPVVFSVSLPMPPSDYYFDCWQEDNNRQKIVYTYYPAEFIDGGSKNTTGSHYIARDELPLVVVNCRQPGRAVPKSDNKVDVTQ